jgi:hypothetical protein
LWRYGVGHSQLLVRSLPLAGQRCLDLTFERVTWLSLPSGFDTIEITMAAPDDPAWPQGAACLADEHSPLRLRVASRGVTGFVICARAEGAYTGWSPTGTDSERDEEEVVWSLTKGDLG